MKNLKMFAISLLAFLVMVTGVHATDTDCIMPEDYDVTTAGGKSECAVLVGADHYVSFEAAWKKVSKSGGEITLLKDTNAGALGSGYAEKNVTINLDKYALTMGNWYLGAKDGATLTITGSADAKFISTATTFAFEAKANSKVVINGALTVDYNVDAPVVKVSGEAEIVGGAKLKLDNSAVVVDLITADAKATLNANVGSIDRSGNTLVGAAGLVKTNASSTETTPALTIKGGAYYVSGIAIDVQNGLAVNIEDGKIVSTGNIPVQLTTDGSVTISGGTIEAQAADMPAVYTKGTSVGSLTITGGTLTSAKHYALSMSSKAVKNAISGGTFNGGKSGNRQMPALYINDDVLTGLDDPAVADNFKGILTGGRYLVSIIGGKGVLSAATVQNYVVAEGATVTDDGDYKVINAKLTDDDQNTGDANTPEETNPNVPDVPKTNDNILVYASLGLVSALSVGFSARRKENN